MLTSLRPLGLLLTCALFAGSSQAGELAIQITGTVAATSASVGAPFSSANVGDSVYVHLSVFSAADFSTPGEAIYDVDPWVSSIRVGQVTSPISGTPFLAGASTVTLVDGATDQLRAGVRMPGDQDIFVTEITDTTGGLIADPNIIGMQGHSAGPFTLGQGWMKFGTPSLTQITIQIELVKFMPQDDSYGPFCTGDGSSTPCPCGNVGNVFGSCTNSTGRGARLFPFGFASVSNDSLTLVAIQQPPGVPGLVLSGNTAINGGQGFAFGDGLLCVGGGTQRLNVETTSPLGTAAWGPGIVNQIGASAGDLKRFQTWYRDTSGPCGSGFNFSHGITVQVTP